MLAWIYGSGFPKSLDISKAIDKSNNSNRDRQLQFVAWMKTTGLKASQINEIIGKSDVGSHYLRTDQPAIATAELFDLLRPYLPEVPEYIERLVAERTGIEWSEYKNRAVLGKREVPIGHAFASEKFGKLADSHEVSVTAPATPEAEKWNGWGTALKPAFEPIIIAYKPIKEEQTMQLNLEAAIVYHGNNLDILPTLPDNSVDSIVTDPPYELGFMGKKWDNTGIAYNVELWEQCLRVLKPGGHLLAFGGTRTFHRIAVAIEDAGFEIRDSIAWMYGSGFPKSLDISKAIDKAAGVQRELLGLGAAYCQSIASGMPCPGHPTANRSLGGGINRHASATAPATPEAATWQGWGTALKPAFEPIIVARKPLIGTVAENVLQYGTGGLNIDGSRVKGTPWQSHTATGLARKKFFTDGDAKEIEKNPHELGRWPANLILDEYTAELLDEQSGVSKSTPIKGHTRSGNQIGDERTAKAAGLYGDGAWISGSTHNDSGGASRFFYIAKASKRDRNEGLEELPEVKAGSMSGGEETRSDRPTNHPMRQNFHPTVKPTQLMRYLVKLVTPPGGTVLDPFTGSGSTGKAAILEGFDFIGIELTQEYLPIIEGRLKHAIKMRAEEQDKQEEMLF